MTKFGLMMLMMGGWVIGLMIFVIALVVGAYILTALGLFNMAKNNGLGEKAFIAWIPLANIWLICLLIGDIKWEDKQIPSIALVIGYVVIGYFNGLISNGIISLILTLAGAITVFALYYELYRRIVNIKQPIAISVVCSIIPLVTPIVLFMSKNAVLLGVEEIDYREMLRKYINI